jgi:hypothetical protein
VIVRCAGKGMGLIYRVAAPLGSQLSRRPVGK